MNIKYILGGILFTFAFSSCEDVLSTKTTFELEDADVWHVPDLAKGVLHKAYQGIQTRPDCFDNNFLDCATDNAVTNVYSSVVYKLGLGGMTSIDNPIANWGNCYKMIEYINSFLENGLTDNTLYNRVDEEKDKIIKERLRGEALFLRAWWHFELLKMYGGKGTDGVALGIPYFDHFITQEEASNKGLFVRPTYAKTVDCIIDDLDEAMDLLPSDYTSSEEEFNNQQMGRANKLAAAVLKSRVLVYSASPAYQDDDIVKITGMGQYEILNPDYYKSKWTVVAMEINKILSMQVFEDFTILNKTMIADAGTTPSDDFVFYKYFNTNALEKQQFPPFYYGNANTNPSHNLVMAFCSKKNGFPAYDSRSGIDYNAEGFNMIDDLYSKLDNRFRLNIYTHKMPFGDSGEKIDILPGRKDSKEYSENASRSGYYLAKFVSAKASMLNPTQTQTSPHYNPLLRKIEVFLNFAEAANEAWGPTDKKSCLYSAYDIMSDIRSTSTGINDDQYLESASTDETEFRKLIQNERRIEFAFENQRYFDMRRWLLPLNETVQGVSVSLNDNNDEVFTVFDVEQRKYEIKNYYTPLPYDEVAKNSNLVNNFGW